jgi:hypothetical protein
VFAIPVTLLSTNPAPQSITFTVTTAFGTKQFLRSDNGQPLTGTFVVTLPLTVSQISPIATPRTEPVSSVDVTFSKVIDPTTFTTADLKLTRDGVDVPLASDVTITSTDNQTFHVGGLTTYTTPFGAYVFTVDATGVKDPSGQSGTGSLSESFTVQSPNAPPTVFHISPITTPRSEPVSSIGVTFSKSINPSTFTTAALSLTREGVLIPLTSGVTFSTTDDQTFSVGGLAPFTTPPGSYGLTVSAATVRDQAGVQGTGSQSVDFTVVAPVVDTGPRVVGLQRFGVHTLPTMLVLTFDRPLNPASAVNPNNYLVLGPGHDRRIDTPDDIPVPLLSGFYNSANNTVTLVMAKPINLFRTYRIIVRGTGPTPVRDINGVALDGAGNGTPGTDFTTKFSREILNPGKPSRTTPTNPARVSGAGRFSSFAFSNP